jgi:hypothetical protein
MDWPTLSLLIQSITPIISVNRKKITCFILHNWREIFQYVCKYKNNPSETRDSGTQTEGNSKVTSSACCSLSHTNKRTCIRRRCTTSTIGYVIVINMTTTRCLVAIVFYPPITKPLAKQMWCITDETSIIFTENSYQTSQHRSNNIKAFETFRPHSGSAIVHFVHKPFRP